jgi:uncharacterized protein YciI
LSYRRRTVYFFVKTTNPRPTFHVDMSPEERATMGSHVQYWTDFAKQGRAIAFGPVLDKAGPYGVLIAKFENEESLKQALAEDPARSIFGYSWSPMADLVSETTAQR